MTGPPRAAPDWLRIEADYRQGVLPLRAIAAADGQISESAIRKRAARDGWVRGPAAKGTAMAPGRGEAAAAAQMPETAAEPAEPAQAAELAQLRHTHCQDIGRARHLTMAMLAELEAETGDPALFVQLGELMRNTDTPHDKLNDVYQKAIGLGGRVDNTKKLIDALKYLIALEREAYGLGAEARKLDVTVTGKKVVELSEDALIAIAAGASAHPR